MLVVKSVLLAQNDFVTVKDSHFYLKGREFAFLGFNAYYLQSEAAKGNFKIVDNVFSAAKKFSVKVIRTWAFFESDDSLLAGVIRYAPDQYNENSLKGLDYVLQKARENDIKLIVTLANGYPDFGGIGQYINWANRYMLPQTSGKQYTTTDFFTSNAIKHWYKDYASYLLNRTNSINGIKYKDDPAVFCLEMINEAENILGDYSLLLNWYDEMSTYIRKIDTNHLIATGEAGYDRMDHLYSDYDFFYNGGYFLVNGYKGTSFYSNSTLRNIDLATYHLYPDGWGISPEAGNTWIRDHEEIAYTLNKPAVVGEFGIRKNKDAVYKDWIASILKTRNRSGLVWQYLPPELENINDGYGFNEENSAILDSIKQYNDLLNSQVVAANALPFETTLEQNYPNPFNPVTNIRYKLKKDENVLIELFNPLGERIKVLEEGFRHKGEYQITLSFDEPKLSSGIYFYTMITSEGKVIKKMMLLK